MKFEKINNWVTMLTNVGVLIGIVLLLVELNQNTTALKTEADEVVYSLWSDLNKVGSTSPGLAEIIVKGNKNPKALTEAELFRYQQYFFQAFNVIEHNFRAAKRGNGTTTLEVTESTLALTVSNPGSRAFYEDTKSLFRTDYIAWADKALARIDAAEQQE